MSFVVLRVSKNEIGMGDAIVSAGAAGLPSCWNARSFLHIFDGCFGSGQADKPPIEIVELPAQFRTRVARGIRRNKNQFHAAGSPQGQLLQGRRDVGHVHRALIRAICITEEQECNRTLRSVPEIKRSTGGIHKGKSRFRQGRPN